MTAENKSAITEAIAKASEQLIEALKQGKSEALTISGSDGALPLVLVPQCPPYRDTETIYILPHLAGFNKHRGFRVAGYFRWKTL
jgi:hypothetical protein